MARRVAARGGAVLSLLPLLLSLIAGFSSFPVLEATTEGTGYYTYRSVQNPSYNNHLYTVLVSTGDALFAMMMEWGITFPGWARGGDPCARNWTYVTCRGGKVVELNVTNTGIKGSFPSEIGDLQALEVLDLSNLNNRGNRSRNALSGAFPDSLAQCTALKSFNASNMEWDIPFPVVLTKLSKLEELYISAANLTGTIPDDFFNLQSLRSLFLGTNSLSGDLAKFASLKNLVLWSANSNEFAQALPAELGTLDKLEYLNLHTCKLYGGLPEEFSNLKSLKNLTLQRNSLTGSIPMAFKPMTNMTHFRVDQNYLSGPFPEWMITSWPRLNYLGVSKNSLSGPAPNLQSLDSVYNVSYSYWQLKWDCNYLNGISPCSNSEPCSQQTNDLLEKELFDFEKNCYSDSGQQDLAKVQNDCDQYHFSDVSCQSFYSDLASGRCPRCPSDQKHENSRKNGSDTDCVCIPDPSSGKGHGVPVGAVVGSVLGTVALFSVVICFIMYKRRKQFAFLDRFIVHDEGHEHWEIPPGVEKFSLHDLAKMTHNFSDANMIGQGGFGKVFVGTLGNGKMVAIKRATAGGLQGTVEFKNEISLLSRLHHRHLVKLEGFCDEENMQILVYEFMKNGNLHTHLLGKITTTPLHWYKRLEIAYEVAHGLEYLHSYADPPVIHRDVKPTNILLDDHMVAKLADFGISKVSPEYDTHVSTRPAGTAGYLDPDYFLRRQLTTASDVYAYGVVLLELVTGQEAIDHSRLEEFNLVEWVKKRFITRGVVSIVDPLIEHEYNPEAFAEMSLLGLKCSSFDRNERPTMKEVLATLTPFMMEAAPPKHKSDSDMEALQELWKRKRSSGSSFERDTLPEISLLNDTQKTTLSDSAFFTSSSDRNTHRSTESEYEPNRTLMNEHLGPR